MQGGPQVVETKIKKSGSTGQIQWLGLGFSEELDKQTVFNQGNIALSDSGIDGIFGTLDDQLHDFELEVLFYRGRTRVKITPKSTLEHDTEYRLVAGDLLQDLAGNRLDGDGDVQAGGDFVWVFTAS